MITKKNATDKRSRISQAQTVTMLEVLGASLVLGTCLVLANFARQYIAFNAQVITAKNDAISAYDQALRSIGVCADANQDKRLSDDELQSCKPDEVSLDQVVNSLRYKVFEEMTVNEDLETVARKRNSECYDPDGERINFKKLYQEATEDTQRQILLQGMKVCSALRVIPDALPAQKNTEALMASLNQIFIVSEWDPESISPRDENVVLDDYVGVEAIPVSLSANADGATIIRILKNLDRSIRNFDITTATFEWKNSKINLTARANAFYLNDFWDVEVTKTIRAGDKK